MRPNQFPEQVIDEYVRKGYWDTSLISESWDENAALYPDEEAVIEENARISWSQAKEQIDRIALGLLELGIKRGEKIAIQLCNCIELFTVRLACEKAGIIVVTLLPNLRHAEVASILKLTQAVGIVISKEFRRFDYFRMIQELLPEMPFLKFVFVAGDDVPEGAISVKEMAERPLEKQYPPDYLQKTRFNAFETFQIATTTGTTGMPKCIEFVSCVRQFTGKVVAQRLKITHDDVVGAFAPVIAGGCYNEVYRAAPIMAGKIVLAKYFTTEEILGLIEREKVTAVATVPTVLIRALDEPNFEKYDLSSLRLVKYGGASLPYGHAISAWKKFRCPVLPAYGTLDIGTIASSFADSPPETFLNAVYQPLDGVEVKIVDANTNELSPGEIGELLVRGPQSEPGYFNDPEATAEVCRNGWFHTGDLASFDPKEGLIIRGRLKDVIIRGGQNIHPLEIETMLIKHPKVLKAAVVGMPDPEMLEKACAYVVLKPGEEFNFSEMQLFLKEQGIAPFKIPERLEIVDDMPLVGDIKVDKKRLRKDIEAKLREEGMS